MKNILYIELTALFTANGYKTAGYNGMEAEGLDGFYFHVINYGKYFETVLSLVDIKKNILKHSFMLI